MTMQKLAAWTVHRPGLGVGLAAGADGCLVCWLVGTGSGGA